MRSVQVDLAVRSDALIGEGPLWDERAGVLLWVDLAVGALHRSDLDDGSDAVTTYGENVSALALTDTGGLAVAMRRGFARIVDDRLVDVQELLPPGFRMNDAKTDPYGCFVGGSLSAEFDSGRGSLWRWCPGAPPEQVLDGLTQPNGMAWTPDGSVFYFCDTRARTVTAYGYSADGVTGPGRVLLELSPRDGEPDGMCSDADGGLWLAFWGGSRVRRYAPDGRLTHEVAMPVSQPSCPAFAGGTRMAVTTASTGLDAGKEPLAGSVFVFDAGVEGVPVGRLRA
jgi:sugar lactone lactonase YvrE